MEGKTSAGPAGDAAETGTISRRYLLAAGAVAAGGLSVGPEMVRRALAAPARAGRGPYGPLLPPDANGVQLPAGFSSRRIASASRPVPGTSYVLPIFPDGQATYRTADGGWILVTNSESIASVGAGVSAIRFDRRGEIVDAYRILGETNFNCAGGPTPWGTWLSGEETDDGMIWECDPAGVLEPEPRPMLGLFSHEAAAVDPVRGRIYLTEDDGTGCFYRFTPAEYPSLDSGKLEAAVVAANGSVDWREVRDPTTAETGVPTQDQVRAATRFNGGEGIWYARGTCYFTTKGDKKVWAYDTKERRLRVIFDREQAPNSSLDAVDNVTVNALGDVFVCEDGGNMEIGLISRENTVSPMLRLPDEHPISELCGVCFDPSGGRMYFTSQRGGVSGLPGPGHIFEIKGPFRLPKKGQPADFVYGPPAGEARPRGPLNPAGDQTRPRLRVKTRKRIGSRRLIRRGLRVKVRTGEPALLAFTLLSSDFGTKPRKIDGQRRTRSVRLARIERGERAIEMNQPAARATLKPRRAARSRLRKRLARKGGPIAARLLVVAVDGNGNRTAVAKRIKIRRG
jgi:uncharacterized protein